MSELPGPSFANRRSHDARAVVESGGECDMATLDQLNKVLREAVAARARVLVIDLAHRRGSFEITALDDYLSLPHVTGLGVEAAKRASHP
jgi:hypothetical protein